MKVINNKAKLVKLKICEKVSDFIKQNFIEDINILKIKIKLNLKLYLIIP